MGFKVHRGGEGREVGQGATSTRIQYRIKLYLDWESSGAVEKLILEEISSVTFCGK